MVGWYYPLSGHKFEQTPGDGEGQVSLVCCSPWGCKELDTAEQLNNSKSLLLDPKLKQKRKQLFSDLGPSGPTHFISQQRFLIPSSSFISYKFCYSLTSVKLVLKGYPGYPNHLSQEFVLVTQPSFLWHFMLFQAQLNSLQRSHCIVTQSIF